MKKQKNVTFEHGKSQSLERDPDITEMIEFAYNDFKTAIINTYIQGLKENTNIMNSAMETIKKTYRNLRNVKCLRLKKT